MTNMQWRVFLVFVLIAVAWNLVSAVGAILTGHFWWAVIGVTCIALNLFFALWAAGNLRYREMSR